MTYSAAIEYLYGLQKHGIKLGLETMRILLGNIGHPERQLRILHIGGTNGKGSTGAMAAAILQASGLRVGLYTSPHLVEFRERIRVNGDMIREGRMADLTGRLCAAVPRDLAPTFFEMTTAMALLHFVESQVDIVVLEVGLGGRFDATNVVEPLACAITTIALDHQEYLGRTEDAIAFEKAGIIKTSVPVVIGRMGLEACGVMRRVAQERGAPLWRLGHEFFIEGDDPELFAYRGVTRVFEGLRCGLAGRHQLDNAACALALLEAADKTGVVVDQEAVRQGLRSVVWEGRLELIEEYPKVLLDGAHNPSAAAALACYLQEFLIRHPDSRIILVWGMMRDKDHRGFIAPLQSSLMLLGDVKAAVRGCGLSPIRG
ncbi:MAG: bifunctional folylpolyglutamate synthase/dihydrofolate synthase [Nitrospirae bacterium]|nr:bifunctional folylpolyglutamate synthase/dihydrofolate synthase [Nitrospirota bacterium]